MFNGIYILEFLFSSPRIFYKEKSDANLQQGNL